MTTPATEVRSFAVTIPAGTPVTSPLVTPVTMPARVVEAVHWKVPPGPSGLMGWRLTMSGGNPVVPVGGGWIIADDEDATWALVDQPDSGAWEITGYNTDIYQHTVYVDFLLSLVAAGTPVTTQIPSSSISSPSPVTTLETVTTAPVSIPLVSVPAISVPAISVPPVITAIQPVFGTVPGVTVPPLVSVPPVTIPAPVFSPPDLTGMTVAAAVATVAAAGGVINDIKSSTGHYYDTQIYGTANAPVQSAGMIVTGYNVFIAGVAGHNFANSVEILVT